jgi:predicted ATPase
MGTVESGVAGNRLDHLPPGERLVLKVASVVGRKFSHQILRDILPAEGERTRLDEVLQGLEGAGILEVDLSGPSAEYSFRSASTWEAIYGTLLFAQRRQLHRAVAEWYEEVHAEDLRACYPTLAHHWRGADDSAKAIDYLERAANEATRCGRLQEAESYLEESLELSARSGVLSASFHGQDGEAKAVNAS